MNVHPIRIDNNRFWPIPIYLQSIEMLYVFPDLDEGHVCRTCAGNQNGFARKFREGNLHGFPLDLSINQPLVISSNTRTNQCVFLSRSATGNEICVWWFVYGLYELRMLIKWWMIEDSWAYSRLFHSSKATFQNSRLWVDQTFDHFSWEHRSNRSRGFLSHGVPPSKSLPAKVFGPASVAGRRMQRKHPRLMKWWLVSAVDDDDSLLYIIIIYYRYY